MAMIYRFIVQCSMRQDKELKPRIENKYLKFLRERRPNQSDKGT